MTNGIVPKSNNIKYQTAGTFDRQAVYTGDADNRGRRRATAPTRRSRSRRHGQLQICKATDNGTIGTSFFFIVTDSGGVTAVTVAGGTAPIR